VGLFVTASRAPSSKHAQWRRSSYEILTSDVAAGRNAGPRPPPQWALTLKQLTALSRAPTLAPPWWTPRTAFFGNVETRTDPSSYHWDGMKRLGGRDQPMFFFQFTMAGWGSFQLYEQKPRKIAPGTGFMAIVPSEHRYFLPEDSPGWTFGWIGIYHPYLLARVQKQVAATGPCIETPPDGALTASALRLLRGAIKKDFRDRYAVELALFEFVLSYERWVNQARDSSSERKRCVEAVRARILAQLPNALAVDALAAEHGMSRSHFSHWFRNHTGLTPARFAAEVRVQEASRMLLQTDAPLKQVAHACGFANANHFCRVFRRFQHLSPATYRNAIK
jgi:AraC-like DNA-binding protein